MSREPFVSLIAEAFDMAKGIVHQRQRTTATEFANRVKRLSVCLESLNKCEQHWATWPQSPTTFGQYQRAGDSALHVAYQFAKTINSAVQVAKVTAIGMPNSELSQDQLSEWLEATRVELETVTLDLSDWPSAALMRDADLILRQIQVEYRLPIAIDSNEVKYQQAIPLWNEGSLSWSKITEQLGEPKGDWKAFSQSVKRFAKRTDQQMRTGKPGSKRKSE